MRVAVVDIGTNSTRLLIADVGDGGVQEIERRTTVTRLGEGVDSSGRLRESAIERVLSACAQYRESIDRHDVSRTVAVLTSAVRDADNGGSARAHPAQALRLRSPDDQRRARGPAHLPRRHQRPQLRLAAAGARHRRRQHRVRGGKR